MKVMSVISSTRSLFFSLTFHLSSLEHSRELRLAKKTLMLRIIQLRQRLAYWQTRRFSLVSPLLSHVTFSTKKLPTLTWKKWWLSDWTCSFSSRIVSQPLNKTLMQESILSRLCFVRSMIDDGFAIQSRTYSDSPKGKALKKLFTKESRIRHTQSFSC